MSTAVRLISGSAASWARILITMIAQIALVPIYLNYWTVEAYGVWLAIQALISVMTLLDQGHQAYLGFEFLRLARHEPAALSRNLWSAIAISFCLGFVQVIAIVVFIYSGLLPHLLGKADLQDASLIGAAGTVLLLQGIAWFIASSASGMFVRALEPFGYLPRLAWWGVFVAIITNVAPAIAVVFGADFITTGIVLVTSTLVFNVPLILDIFSLMRKENIKITQPRWTLGFKNLLRSTGIMGKMLLENARQQGVRLVLAPLAGAVGIAAFSTMRTGSNVALQGLNTITNPLMPDLMRFLHDRDQVRSEAGFATIWIVVIGIIAPGVIIIQAFIEPLFEIWTKGHIAFNPTLFAILSLSVLVYAIAQPAMAVVIGNNLIRPQLILSAVAAIAVVGGIALMVPWIGIEGAGLALLLAEILAATGNIIYANRWLQKMSLRWPSRSFWTAVISVLIAAAGMAGMIILPFVRLPICGLALLLCALNLFRYWKILPTVVTHRFKEIITNLLSQVRKVVQPNHS